MVESRLQDLRSLLRALPMPAASGVEIECKHFFSGAAAYVDGRIFMTLTTVGLALKLPPDSRDTLVTMGAGPLRYFPDGPIKKDYVVVPAQLVSNPTGLSPWIAASMGFCRTVPPPPRRAKRRRR